MTKTQLIERLASLPADAPISFALFTLTPKRGYHWQLLTPTIDHDDPVDVIGLSTAPFHYDTLIEMSRL